MCIRDSPKGEGWGEGKEGFGWHSAIGFSVAVLLSLLFFVPSSFAQSTVEQWGVYEVALNGPTNGNPFLDMKFSARFTQGDSTIEANGFYDSDGIYRVRFMPEKKGKWSYSTASNAKELNGQSGEFTVTPPSANNHG